MMALDVSRISLCRIYPGIGIARLGNSPTDFFIGPETPGEIPNSNSTFKDAVGRIKRQGARFRIFGFDANGQVVDEITSFDAKIQWTVHLANKKGAWRLFKGRFNQTTELRNPSIQGGSEFVADPDLRTSLIVDPGPRSISGANRPPVLFEGGRFLDLEVALGEMRTDEMGRLIVLGGFGRSGMTAQGQPIANYANNNYWHDDASDGPVTATVTLGDGRKLVADGAWVLVAPPKFTPGLENLVTLYDVIEGVAIDMGYLPKPENVEFHRDVYPILRRAANYAWVNAQAQRGHGDSTGGNFLAPNVIALLADPKESRGAALRSAIFERVRKPAALADETTRKRQAVLYYMPQLSGDDGDVIEGNPDTFLTILPRQYEILQAWADGNFITGAPSEFAPYERIPLAERPAALDRAALSPCVGGPFFPGIEMTYIAADPELYSGAFRLAKALKPGDITKHMAVPWQADFFECSFHWWPAQRPDDVVTEQEFETIASRWKTGATANGDGETSDSVVAALGYRAPWTRGLAEKSPEGDNDMVKYWNELGFIVPRQAPSGETVHVETERTPYAGMNERELFYMLMNVDKFPDCLPKARAFVEQCLEEARRIQKDPATPDIWRPFRYSPDLFSARMNETYSALVAQVHAYDPATDPIYRSRADVVERIRQFAPFNMSDGSWLRYITRVGPIDEVRALLFSVLMDEMGDGVVSHNHSNIYRDLCHSVGFYPAPATSREFAMDPSLLDSAFTVPTFELAISQFSESYYPELLGMTLQLEWGIIEAKNTISLMQYFGFNPHYWIMHVGIDNPVNGHAQRAFQAIQLYIDQVRANGGGEDEVQRQWRRIWDGYVAFGTVGTFGQDFADLLRNRPTPHDRMIDLINRKAPFGSLNHDQHRLGPNKINGWFSDPEGFLKELVKSGYIIPGDPENSPFFRLTSFETGRMYRVFTPEELELWADWTRSLAQPEPPPFPLDPATDMMRVIQMLRERQTGQSAHQAALLAPAEGGERRPVSWWFTQPLRDFMAALSNPANKLIVKGDPDQSLFVTSLVAPSNSMGAAFADKAPGTGRSGREILIAWIKANCPLPEAQPTILNAPHIKVRNLWLSSPRSVVASHPTGRILGIGSYH